MNFYFDGSQLSINHEKISQKEKNEMIQKF